MDIRRKTYGIAFPFSSSDDGNFFEMTKTPIQEAKTMMVHYFLTDKGSRYMYPEFGTRLKYLLFEPNDEIIKQEVIREINLVENFVKNVKIRKVDLEAKKLNADRNTVIAVIDYVYTDNSFEYNDNITIEL